MRKQTRRVRGWCMCVQLWGRGGGDMESPEEKAKPIPGPLMESEVMSMYGVDAATAAQSAAARRLTRESDRQKRARRMGTGGSWMK
jgi:hypothetical protein